MIATAMVVFTLLGLGGAIGLPGAINRAYFRGDGADDSRRLITASAIAALLTASVAELTGPLWSEIFSGIGYGAPLRWAVWASSDLRY